MHKAPANEVVRGAIDLEVNITRNEHDLLNPDGINVHPRVPRPRHPGVGRAHPLVRPGLALPQRAAAVQLPRGVDPERHQLGGLRAERRGAVGQDPPHHLGVPGQRVAQGRAVRRHAGRGVLRQVRRETNPAEGIDAGQVVCEIGVAPVKPAEFVIFRLAQFSGGTSLVSE